MSTAIILLLAFSVQATADEITNSLEEALKQYKAGNFSSAATSVDYASQMIRQKRAESLETFLPKPLSGWNADSAVSRTIDPAMMGGGVFVEKRYYRGTSSVIVKIVTDSPMMQSVMMMFTNPMFLSASGGKIEKIKGEKAIIEYNPYNMSGEIKVLVQDRVLVTITASGATKEDMLAYADNIEYPKLVKAF
ncbi:MAG: hypothetical protein PHW46_03905, partial [Candidatus Omnitrophica bacterium]|nr:hypothetical protein [Candidatus Omnitrophota bacterium]